MKLACVVQRYGADIAGGSEAHCRAIAERLQAAGHDVTVLTTCARDYVTWRNEWPSGETVERGVRVRRFPVRRERRLKRFADLSDVVFDGHAAPSDQRDWFLENGPDAPGLLQHLEQHRDGYDLVLFWTFRYAPSYFGLPLVADRAVLLPTAEDDAALNLDVLQDYFRAPAGYLFLTPEEQALVSTRAGQALEPSAIIGMGLDPAAPASGAHVLRSVGVPDAFVLYLGRVDRNKGCDTLFDYFQTYAETAGDQATTLVLAGPSTIPVPAHPRIAPLGYVSNEVRHALLSHAQALLVPSPYESLSIVLLEGWNQAVPALVNAQCSVLQGQVRRANGGLFYRSAREFVEALQALLDRPGLRSALGRQGLAYVDQEYRWPTVIQRVETLLAAVHARRTER